MPSYDGWLFDMIQSKIQVSSEDYYSCELTSKIPVRVTIVTINGLEGFGILEPLNGDEGVLQHYVAELRASESIVTVEISHQSRTAYWTRVIHHLDYPSIYETILETGSMTLLPIVIEKGIQNHLVLSPTSQALKRMLDTLRSRFMTVKIRMLSSKPVNLGKSLLTSKQLEAFKLAYKSGYYEIPRCFNLADLAPKLGIKRVAMQERIRRAELRIFADYIKEYAIVM